MLNTHLQAFCWPRHDDDIGNLIMVTEAQSRTVVDKIILLKLKGVNN
jgi:hypothetical protein